MGNCLLGFSGYLPAEGPWLIDRMNSKAYVSQFSTDGTLFVAGVQNRQMRIYDVENGWKVQKDTLAENLRWTVTDASLSPDQRFLVYSTMSPIVHIVDAGSRHAGELSVANVTLVVSMVGSRHAGELTVANVTEDVNAVSFADEAGHILYSGSDDSFCKLLPGGRAMWSGTIDGWIIQSTRDSKHPNNQSLSIYEGHKVLCTLIGCYFSPMSSTGHKYIYAGSYDGCVYIFDVITGAIVGKLVNHSSTVRDCSWHPFYPTLVTSSWDRQLACWEVSAGNHPKISNLKKTEMSIMTLGI